MIIILRFLFIPNCIIDFCLCLLTFKNYNSNTDSHSYKWVIIILRFLFTPNLSDMNERRIGRP